VVFTIHNMNYGQKKIAEAAQFCNRFTTVSPTYAFEVGSHPAIAGACARARVCVCVRARLCWWLLERLGAQTCGWLGPAATVAVRGGPLPCAGCTTPVSPPRPSTHAHALAHRKRAHTHATANGTKFLGIRNGIDNDIWNPTENVFLPMSFDAMTCDQGKRRCVRGMWTCGRCSC
jgi:hypothetical protein